MISHLFIFSCLIIFSSTTYASSWRARRLAGQSRWPHAWTDEARGTQDYLSQAIPDDVYLEIFKKLNLIEKVLLSCVCKRFESLKEKFSEQEEPEWTKYRLGLENEKLQFSLHRLYDELRNNDFKLSSTCKLAILRKLSHDLEIIANESDDLEEAAFAQYMKDVLTHQNLIFLDVPFVPKYAELFKKIIKWDVGEVTRRKFTITSSMIGVLEPEFLLDYAQISLNELDMQRLLIGFKGDWNKFLEFQDAIGYSTFEALLHRSEFENYMQPPELSLYEMIILGRSAGPDNVERAARIIYSQLYRQGNISGALIKLIMSGVDFKVIGHLLALHLEQNTFETDESDRILLAFATRSASAESVKEIFGILYGKQTLLVCLKELKSQQAYLADDELFWHIIKLGLLLKIGQEKVFKMVKHSTTFSSCILMLSLITNPSFRGLHQKITSKRTKKAFDFDEVLALVYLDKDSEIFFSVDLKNVDSRTILEIFKDSVNLDLNLSSLYLMISDEALASIIKNGHKTTPEKFTKNRLTRFLWDHPNLKTIPETVQAIFEILADMLNLEFYPTRHPVMASNQFMIQRGINEYRRARLPTKIR